MDADLTDTGTLGMAEITRIHPRLFHFRNSEYYFHHLNLKHFGILIGISFEVSVSSKPQSPSKV